MPATEIALAIQLADPQFGQLSKVLRTSNVLWQFKQFAKLNYQARIGFAETQNMRRFGLLVTSIKTFFVSNAAKKAHELIARPTIAERTLR